MKRIILFILLFAISLLAFVAAAEEMGAPIMPLSLSLYPATCKNSYSEVMISYTISEQQSIVIAKK